MNLNKILALIFAFSLISNLFAGGGSSEPVNTPEEIKEYIKHHVQDTYDFGITKGISFPLPVILWDEGLQVFMSSKFNHGLDIAEHNGNYYILDHGKIFRTDAEGSIERDSHGHATNPRPLDFSITKNVFVVMFLVVVLCFIFINLAQSYTKRAIPKGFGRVLEPLVVFVRDEIARPNIGEKHYRKYMSYLLTVFFFIWMVNLCGLTPFGVNVTNNISITFALAFITFLITQFTANKNYWGHIFWMPGVPIPFKIILMPIELFGVFLKPAVLMMRLYANILAGHVVLMSIIALMFTFEAVFAKGAFFGLTLFMAFIELLVAFLQAYIFTMLSALYFGFAVEEHH